MTEDGHDAHVAGLVLGHLGEGGQLLHDLAVLEVVPKGALKSDYGVKKVQGDYTGFEPCCVQQEVHIHAYSNFHKKIYKENVSPLQWLAVRVTPSGNSGDLNFSRTVAVITKWFWVTIEGYLSYLLPKFKDLIPTSLGDIAI